MAVLGINTWGERSSACLISDKLQISALCDTHSSAFCTTAIRTLSTPYEPIHTVVTHQHSANAVRQALPHTRVQTVDYCEALSLATIASTDWDKCAILLCDDYYTRLGYYAQGTFYWIREFCYPNSIALFGASAARFLGYATTDYEQQIVQLGEQGVPVYTPWIKQHVLSMQVGSYQLLHNAERGFGVGVACANAAASVQHALCDMIVNLARWLRTQIDTSRLAIVGRIAANGAVNSAVAELSDYEHIAAISMHGAAATALGAAALIRRPLLEHAYIGVGNAAVSYSAEDAASRLLRGDSIAYVGTSEFSSTSATNNCLLTLAYAPKLHALTTHYRVICQDRDYHSWFAGKHIPYFGQYRVAVKNKQVINATHATVVATSKNKNPYINRVLELTRAQGYPILVSTPLI